MFNNKYNYRVFWENAEGGTDLEYCGMVYGFRSRPRSQRIISIDLYSGLNDKWGHPIYKNDIILINMGHVLPDILIVVYGDRADKFAAFGLEMRRKYPDEHGSEITFDFLNRKLSRDCKVIGNAHQNKDLIKLVYNDFYSEDYGEVIRRIK